jgi:hypothetical protein
MDEANPTVSVEFSRSELDLLRTALRLLLSTLGREEADELVEVQALLAKIDRPAA